jgi:integrase
VSLPDGQRKWVYSTTKSVAQERLRALHHGPALEVAPPSPDPTLADFLPSWLDSVQARVGASTFRSYSQTVHGPRKRNGTGLIPGVGHRRLGELSVLDVESYLRGLVESGARGHTPARHRAVLSAALSDAIRWGLLERNAASRARTPATVRAREPRTLTLDEARRLIEGTRDDRLHALWVLALYTGMREAELLGLSWADVDFVAGTITCSHQLGRRDGGWVLTEPKTKAGHRTIALAFDALAAVHDHQRRMDQERRSDWRYYGLVFVTEDGNPIYGWRVLEQLYEHEERLGLPHVRVHDLRHTAASLMQVAGLSLEDAKVTLGHSSIRVTSDVYSHQQPEQRARIGAAMQRVLGSE